MHGVLCSAKRSVCFRRVVSISFCTCTAFCVQCPAVYCFPGFVPLLGVCARRHRLHEDDVEEPQFLEWPRCGCEQVSANRSAHQAQPEPVRHRSGTHTCEEHTHAWHKVISTWHHIQRSCATSNSMRASCAQRIVPEHGLQRFACNEADVQGSMLTEHQATEIACSRTSGQQELQQQQQPALAFSVQSQVYPGFNLLTWPDEVQLWLKAAQRSLFNYCLSLRACGSRW